MVKLLLQPFIGLVCSSATRIACHIMTPTNDLIRNIIICYICSDRGFKYVAQPTEAAHVYKITVRSSRKDQKRIKVKESHLLNVARHVNCRGSDYDFVNRIKILKTR